MILKFKLTSNFKSDNNKNELRKCSQTAVYHADGIVKRGNSDTQLRTLLYKHGTHLFVYCFTCCLDGLSL